MSVQTKMLGYRSKSNKKKYVSSNNVLAIDVFSGCGGMTLGLKRAGFNVVGAVEIDGLAVETYLENHPEVTVWHTDVRDLSSSQIKKAFGLKKGSLCLLAGCPPCQGFSSIRTLNGAKIVNDSRNDLLYDFLRLVKELLPKSVMLENVPGLANDIRFRNFIDEMKEIGYLGEFRLLNVADYGVPQRRRRLIYLAGYKTKIPFAKPNSKKKFIKDVLKHLPKSGNSGDYVHDLGENHSKKVIQLIENIPKDGGSRTDLPRDKQLICHKRCDGFKDVYGRMSWNDVAPTITSGCFNPSKGRFLHPEENRAITMREAALLQGFPKKYRFPITAGKTAIAEMIGNALPPPFVTFHARQIRKAILI